MAIIPKLILGHKVYKIVRNALSLKYQWTNTVVETGVLLYVDTDMLKAGMDIQMLE